MEFEEIEFLGEKYKVPLKSEDFLIYFYGDWKKPKMTNVKKDYLNNQIIIEKSIVKKLKDNQIDCRPIVTGNFTKNEVIKYFDYEIHSQLINADYLHDNGFFVGNSHVRHLLFNDLSKLTFLKAPSPIFIGYRSRSIKPAC